MEQKINEIKMIFQAAGIDKLPELIKMYSGDTRSGVQALIKSAEKSCWIWKKKKTNGKYEKI